MYQRIVVGTDGTDTARTAVRHALQLARALGASVHVVTAWQPMPALALSGQLGVGPAPTPDPGDWIEPVLDEARTMARTIGVAVETHQVEGAPAQVLLDVATAVDADLLVVGNAGMRGLRGHLASVPNTCAHKAPCAVLLVPTS